MYKQYNEKEKQKLVQEVVEHGNSVAEVAAHYGVATSTLHRWVNETKSIKYIEKDDASRSQLESEIKLLAKERDTLMHAMAIYAREFKG